MGPLNSWRYDLKAKENIKQTLICTRLIAPSTMSYGQQKIRNTKQTPNMWFSGREQARAPAPTTSRDTGPRRKFNITPNVCALSKHEFATYKNTFAHAKTNVAKTKTDVASENKPHGQTPNPPGPNPHLNGHNPRTHGHNPNSKGHNHKFYGHITKSRGPTPHFDAQNLRLVCHTTHIICHSKKRMCPPRNTLGQTYFRARVGVRVRAPKNNLIASALLIR